MEGRLLDEINQLKKDMVLSFTKYSLSGKEHQNKEAVLNSILYSWFETVHSSQDFFRKYDAFKKLDSLIQSRMLFDMTEACTLDLKSINVQRAIDAYHSILAEEDYESLVSLCGYRLPGEFAERNNYYNGTLLQKIQFYRLFLERLDSIDRELLKKGEMGR